VSARTAQVDGLGIATRRHATDREHGMDLPDAVLHVIAEAFVHERLERLVVAAERERVADFQLAASSPRAAASESAMCSPRGSPASCSASA
jgi:hypothetical protein